MPSVVVRMDDTEVELLDEIAKWLHANKYIKESTRSETIRYALFNVLCPTILKAQELKRMAEEEGV